MQIAVVVALGVRLALPLSASSRALAIEFLSSGESDKDDSIRVGVESFGSFLELAVWLVVAFLCGAALGVDVTALTAGFGLTGLALAFTMQKTLEGVGGTLMILASRPFSVGDRITLATGEQGTVERIGMRATEIRTVADGEVLVVPNTELASSRVRNRSRCDFRRVELRVEVEPESIRAADFADVQREMEDAVARHAKHLHRVDKVCLSGVGPLGGYVFELIFFVVGNDTATVREARSLALAHIFSVLERRGVRLAKPVHVSPASASGLAR